MNLYDDLDGYGLPGQATVAGFRSYTLSVYRHGKPTGTTLRVIAVPPARQPVRIEPKSVQSLIDDGYLVVTWEENKNPTSGFYINAILRKGRSFFLYHFFRDGQEDDEESLEIEAVQSAHARFMKVPKRARLVSEDEAFPSYGLYGGLHHTRLLMEIPQSIDLPSSLQENLRI